MSQVAIRSIIQASGLATGLIQQVTTTSADRIDVTEVYDIDNTKPSIIDGRELISTVFTPIYSTSTLYIHAEFMASLLGSIDGGTLALFQDAGFDAIAATVFDISPSYGQFFISHSMVAGTTNPITFAVRAGVDAPGGEFVVNGDASIGGPIYDGLALSRITITEIASGISAGPSFAWTEVTTTPGPTQMAINNGYITNAAGVVGLKLPATAVVGSVIRVQGKGAGGWSISQYAGQTIRYNNTSTTTGVGGTLSSSAQWNAVELLCITANTDWAVQDAVGTLTVV